MLENWNDLTGKLSMISGKAAISKLSEWSKDEFGVQVNSQVLARSINKNEIADEVRIVLTAFENNTAIERIS